MAALAPNSDPASTLRIARDVEEEAWNAFVDASDDAWMFHHRGYLRAVATWPAHEDRSFGLLEDDDLVAIVPLRIERYHVGQVLPWTRLVSQGGVAWRNDLADDTRRELSRTILTHLADEGRRSSAVELHIAGSALAPRAGRAIPEGMAGMARPAAARILDVSVPLETIWSRAERRARNGVRRATKEGVTVRQGEAIDMARYYRLHTETYGRSALQAHPRAYFEEMARSMHSQGRAALFIAEIGGEAVAAANVLHGKRGAFYWTGASDRRGLESSANVLLQWHIIQWTHEHGIASYEVGEAALPGATSKTVALDLFKRAFGGREVAYPRSMSILRPRYAAAVNAGRAILRRGGAR